MKETETRKLKTNTLYYSDEFDDKKMKLVIDDSIILGFHTARTMIYNCALEVKGIGKKRAEELKKLFDNKLIEISKMKEE